MSYLGINLNYSQRLQNIARKGRNGRPAPCRPFCPFVHIRATFWSRSEYTLWSSTGNRKRSFLLISIIFSMKSAKQLLEYMYLNLRCEILLDHLVHNQIKGKTSIPLSFPSLQALATVPAAPGTTDPTRTTTARTAPTARPGAWVHGVPPARGETCTAARAAAPGTAPPARTAWL